ncbi:MAG TPA: hypothetical protein VIY48_05270 [Candidatus Paceibacterota bacterium]
MATAVFIVVVASALILQLLFSILYWVWSPGWIRHPYGRLAQLGSFAHIILLSLYIFFVLFGKYIQKDIAAAVLISGFFPLIFFGILQLVLLKRAVNSSMDERTSNDS